MPKCGKMPPAHSVNPDYMRPSFGTRPLAGERHDGFMSMENY